MNAFIEVMIDHEPYYDSGDYIALQVICLGIMIGIPTLVYVTVFGRLACIAVITRCQKRLRANANRANRERPNEQRD